MFSFLLDILTWHKDTSTALQPFILQEMNAMERFKFPNA